MPRKPFAKQPSIGAKHRASGATLIFYYTRENRHSFNALAGALEKAGIPGLNLSFPETEKKLIAEIAKSLTARRITAAGFSFFTSQVPHMERLAAYLKNKFGDRLRLIAGGPHPSGAPKEVLKMGFDHVTAGDGEKTIIDLAQGLINRRRPDKKIIIPRKTEDLDSYPPFSLKWGKFGPIEITRGCPFGCSYCQTSYLFGCKPRHRSAANILSIVELMKSEELCDIRVVTPDAFAYGSKNGKEICPGKIEELLKGARKILKTEGRIFFGSFPSEVRPDHVTKETLDLTRRYADNKRLVIGAQSGSPKMLAAIRRGHTVEDIYNAVSLALRSGFGADVDFILGLPGERETDAEMTLRAMEDLVRLGARIHAHAFMPLPGTPFADRAPARLSERTVGRLRNLVARGHAFGQWEKQRKLAKKIHG
ncbi:MAG: TIGR04013 family B12-binding domain/radical SAM domain-containing protein [Elusimicrobia bacterium]|nr:TIGR04013 family B12-binding domain/radical SAM domain-containing protein [Elusimicrobiota bacterium]